MLPHVPQPANHLLIQPTALHCFPCIAPLVILHTAHDTYVCVVLHSSVMHQTNDACAGDAVNRVLFDGDPTRRMGARLLQSNAAAHTVAFAAILVLLLLKLTSHLLLTVFQQLLSMLGMGGGSSSGPKLAGLPSLAIAVRSRLLVGPSSYAMRR
jgi:hypothetical protein